MKKKLAKIMVILFLAILGIICMKSLFGAHYSENFANREESVTWSEVNLRETPNGNIIYSLTEGSKVVCTGRTFEFMDGPYPLWVEVNYGEYTGWVVSQSLG